MGAYFENSRKAKLKNLVSERTKAEKRAMRFFDAHGEVGVYPDLVAVIHMYDDLIDAIADQVGQPST